MDRRQVHRARAGSNIVKGSFKRRVAIRNAMPNGTSTRIDELRVCVSRKYLPIRHGKKYGASGTMLPMIRGTVCRNLERRSGRIAAGCAKVNGITAEGSQISPVTRKYFARVGPIARRDPTRAQLWS